MVIGTERVRTTWTVPIEIKAERIVPTVVSIRLEVRV